MAEIWNEFFYRPLFNLLIWLYNNWSNQNLGWAVVYLTIILRVALLPFTIISETSKNKNQSLIDEINKLEKIFKNDPVAKKEEIRKILRKKKINHWAKAFELGIQILVLILLYQVFIGGIYGEKILKNLYVFVDYPGKINTLFYGFVLGEKSYLWAMAVAWFLVAEIYLDYRKRKIKIGHGDLVYFLIFPIFSFVVLLILPMVKSVFILTSLIFSTVIHNLIGIFLHSDKKKEEVAK